MTVAAASTETAYALNAANLGPFATVWPYEAQTDVVVGVDTGAGFVQLASPAGYTQTDAGSGSLVGGGNVTLSASLLTAGSWPANSKLYLRRFVSGGQPSAFGEAGVFSPAACEAAIDHIARQIQELQSRISRAFLLREGETAPNLAQALERAGGYALGFDAATGAAALVRVPNSYLPFPSLAAPPASPALHTCYFDTTLGVPRIYMDDLQWHGFMLT